MGRRWPQTLALASLLVGGRQHETFTYAGAISVFL
jgi:hypothetical protein